MNETGNDDLSYETNRFIDSGATESYLMLVIKRKAADVITIEPVAGVDTSLSIEELFTDGVIEITLLQVGHKHVKVAIEAPAQLQIWRGHAPKQK